MRKLSREEALEIVRVAREKREKPDLIKVTLVKADLAEADLIGADLSMANLNRADLNEANLHGAKLIGADLIEANLIEANLIEANLSWATLVGAALVGADLSKADLREANLREAHLSGASFRKAKVGWTIFGDTDLSVAEGLDTVHHDGPSTIGIDTIYRSNGKIPEVFLRGAGVPDTFITYIASLTSQAIQFYSCFISYSSKDQDFAQRLHNDLQAKGVRCWFAPKTSPGEKSCMTRLTRPSAFTTSCCWFSQSTAYKASG